MIDANFWQDKDNSKKVVKEKKLYEDLVNSLNDSIQKLKDLDDFIKSLSEQLESIETNKNKNLIVKLGKTFKYLIEKENKNDN